MAKKFHEMLVSYYSDKIPELKKEVFERQKQTDNVISWIAGLSTAGIALILSKAIVNPVIDIIYLKISVGFLLLTLISAVIFRLFIYILQQKESSLLFNFEGYCYGLSCPAYGPKTINEHDTIQTIAKSLKDDMGLDYDEWLVHDYLDREFWVQHYNAWADFWNKEEIEGNRNLMKALAPLLGKNPDEVDERMLTSNDTTKDVSRFILLRRVCNFSYFSVMISFLLSISILALGFFIS